MGISSRVVFLTWTCGISVEQLARAAVQDAIIIPIEPVAGLAEACEATAGGASGVIVVSSAELCCGDAEVGAALRSTSSPIVALYDPDEGLDSETASMTGVHAWVPLDENAPRRISGILLRMTGDCVENTELPRRAPDPANARQHLDILLQAAPVGVWELDVATRRLTLSPEWLGRLGYSPDELAPRLSSFQELVHPEDLSRVVGVLDAHLAGSVPQYECEYRVRASSGEWRCILDYGRVVSSDASGRPLRSAGAHVDITERVRAQDAQRLAAIGEVATGVAHELNNLLAGMLMQAGVAHHSQATSDRVRLVDLVLENAQHAGELCQSLTAFARTRAPRQDYVSLDRVIEEAYRIARKQVQNAGISVRRAYEAGECHVYADAGQLQQVFLNLIINACHAMPQGGTLTLATGYRPSDDGSGLVVASVSDTGSGIAPEHVDRVFDAFFTTKPTLGESEAPGIGLGLAVSKSLVTANRGTISAATRPGVGTTFEVCFPCATETLICEAVDAGMLVPGPPRSRGLSVLVAEDEETLRALICEGVAKIAADVVEVGSTPEAIEQLKARHFDAVISDLMMPGGGGYAILEYTHSLENGPPVLLVTGLVGDHVVENLTSQGAAACLLKPFSVSDLLTAVGDITGARMPVRRGEHVA